MIYPPAWLRDACLRYLKVPCLLFWGRRGPDLLPPSLQPRNWRQQPLLRVLACAALPARMLRCMFRCSPKRMRARRPTGSASPGAAAGAALMRLPCFAPWAQMGDMGAAAGTPPPQHARFHGPEAAHALPVNPAMPAGR